MSDLQGFRNALDVLKARGRYRSLQPRAGLDFASNDYLGLAASPMMRRAAQEALARGVPLGAGGSRLLRGNESEHECLEEEAALFYGSERALFMGGGFTANNAIFSALPRPGDLVLFDDLIHASAHDGMRLGRAANQSFRHNDINDAEDKITRWRTDGGTGMVWIAVEGVYSMDGDQAPVPDLVALAKRHDAMLVVDEAHATGVFGMRGRGLMHAVATQENIVTLHTCGKALGASGALICGPAALIETLINKARSFIYATAPSPFNAALVRAALRSLEETPERQQDLLALIDHAHEEAQRTLGLVGLRSQIIPVIIGEDKATMALATRLQDQGFDIRGIRPPTVPRGTSRLRVSVTLNVTRQNVTALFDEIASARQLAEGGAV